MIPLATTTVTCRCRTVQFELVGAAPLAVILDGCADCRRFNRWALGDRFAGNVGLLLPPRPALGAPLRMHYFPNRVRIVAGEERLLVCKLTEGTETLRVVADCCGSLVLGDHPLYNKKLTVVQAETCVVERGWGLDEEQPEDGRIFSASLHEDQVRKLAKYTGPDDFHVSGNESPEEQVRKLNIMCSQVATLAASVEDLPRAEIGEDVSEWCTVQQVVERACFKENRCYIEIVSDGP